MVPNRLLIPLLLIVITLTAWPQRPAAMGVGEETPEDEIPEVRKNYRATVVDRTGVSTQVEQISLNGKVFLSGKTGAGKMAIPFAKIREVRLEEADGDRITAKIKPVGDGPAVELSLKSKTTCYGKTELGYFRILLKDISRIKIQGEMPAEE